MAYARAHTHTNLQCVTGSTQTYPGRGKAPVFDSGLDGSHSLSHQLSPFSEGLVVKVVRGTQSPKDVHSRIAQEGLGHS